MIQETFPMIIGEEEIPNERALLTQEDGPMMASSASVKYIVIHCSATRSTRDYTAEQLLRDHKTRGFRTVGYHFYIRRRRKCDPAPQASGSGCTLPPLEPLQHRYLL